MGLHNLFTKNYIPMGFQPTLPLLLKRDSHNCIAFYYYHMQMVGNKVMLLSPKYRLLFDMATERLVLFEELEHGNEPLEPCVLPEDMDLKLEQKVYIEKLNRALDAMEKEGFVEFDDIFEDWIQAHPASLHQSLRAEAAR